MPSFAYKEVDPEGHETLDVIAKADKLNQWMYETIRPDCTGKILEIGSGIGNISQFFVANGADIVLSDIRDSYCRILEEKFKGHAVLRLDLVHPSFVQAYSEHLGTFDTVFALNVVEHIQDDVQAMSNLQKLLRPGGKAVILVPAYPFLYNRFDLELEHYRRYTQLSLTQVFERSGYRVLRGKYFNAMGMLGWFVSGTLLRKKSIPEGQMSIYNTLVPLFKWIDRGVGHRMGLSVIVVGCKE